MVFALRKFSQHHCSIDQQIDQQTPCAATTMDSEEDDTVLLASMHQRMVVVVADELKKRKVDHRLLPREERRQFRHQETWSCLQYDYLGPKPLFNGREFETMFRVSRSRFQCLMEDIGNSGREFYSRAGKDCFGRPAASLEAKLLLPLKCLACGVPGHCFMDCFSMSSTMAKDCCNEFHDAIVELHLKEHLRSPTQEDLKNTLKLHKVKHRNVDGMIGSLNCMHTHWDKCPVAWQGAFKNGAKKKASIVLEAVSDYHMWFWHASYGYAGTLNDINIMNLSPLTQMFVNGEMEQLEKELVPFCIGEEQFKQLFVLVDGIYPVRTRFVKAIKEPSTDEEKALTSWQEAARKDIERAFGLLQSRFKVLSRSILLRSLQRIESMVTCCLILHNMLVSDRIMEGDCRARHNPANNLVITHDNDVQVPSGADYESAVSKTRSTARARARLCGRRADEEVVQLVTRRSRFLAMINKDESARLHVALMDCLGKQCKSHKLNKERAKRKCP